MSVVDFIVVFGSIILGALCALFVNRFLKTNKENKIGLSKDIRSEFNNLVLEKDVALEAIDKINQFFSEKKIDSYEKDRLLLKYGKLLESYDKRIFKLQPSVEMHDIYLYRKQLYSLVSDSISRLDQKLDGFSNKFNIFKEENNNNKKNYMPIPTLVQKTTPTDRNSAKVGDENIKHDDDEFSLYLDKAGADLNFLGYDENPLVNSSIAGKKNNIGETGKDDYGKNDDVDEPHAKKTDLENLNVEDINKIQKDILQILKRLENPSD
jgi:hypothetical protein